jgi:hypothetical protein
VSLTVYQDLQTLDVAYLTANGIAIFLTQMLNQINEPGAIAHNKSHLANGS